MVGGWFVGWLVNDDDDDVVVVVVGLVWFGSVCFDLGFFFRNGSNIRIFEYSVEVPAFEYSFERFRILNSSKI